VAKSTSLFRIGVVRTFGRPTLVFLGVAGALHMENSVLTATPTS